MTRIFRYILKNDTGMAPCIDQGLVTLAVCKPKLRASAEPGDWVVGLCPAPSPPGLVTWAGRVATSLTVGDFEVKYRGRSDAIYRLQNGAWTRLSEYHPSDEHLRKDLSAPVLVFDVGAAWYFGDAPKALPEYLHHLAVSGRGHRVNGARDGDSERLRVWLGVIAEPGLHGKPHHPSNYLQHHQLTA